MTHQKQEAYFCKNITRYERRKTITVKIGDLLMGSDYPIRIQSMTTTDTMDTQASVEQVIRMVNAGCELVRLTAPSINEASNLQNIKNDLLKRGVKVPLVADIHFTPNAAEMAARIVEKVRINPGNYVDKKKFELLEYTDAEYQEELDRIRARFVPLIKICKEYGTALRIGTNHGSLSDRIMSRYGDTPLGMVESAMEFLRIAEDEGYKNIVLSMKSSNPQVMIEAYRLLVKTMLQNDMHYPLHLGVTEAGDGDDGRIKSALGIGALLEDGIGDTVRVSLTEDPEFEVPVARKLVSRYERQNTDTTSHLLEEAPSPSVYNPYQFQKRVSSEIYNIGGHHVPRVIADYSLKTNITPEDLSACGHIYDAHIDKWHMSDAGCDFIYFGNYQPGFMLPMGVKGICHINTWNDMIDKVNFFPAYTKDEFLQSSVFSKTLNFLFVQTHEIDSELISLLQDKNNVVMVLYSKKGMSDLRSVFLQLHISHCKVPVIIHCNYDAQTNDEETTALYASTDCGGLLADGFGDGILFSSNTFSTEWHNRISFGILQAARARITKTEYISCPSCGRTLFDLQETTALIRKHTDHLKGVKIAIMGCIVNGPGEMADADYGYVGSGPEKITLYRGKTVVKKGIQKETAVQELINLIKEDGVWIEKS